jgi:hypothetical protein
VLLLLASASQAQQKPTYKELPNFRKVSDGLHLGAQPQTGDPNIDLFCKYDKTAADFYNNNELVDAPWVGGVSGGPPPRRLDG